MLDDGPGVMLFHDAVWVYVVLLSHHCPAPMWAQFADVLLVGSFGAVPTSITVLRGI